MHQHVVIVGIFSSTKTKESGKYVIRNREIKSDEWYFKFIEEMSITNKVIWTPRITLARIFPNEQEVEEFKYAFLKNRSCDIIVLEKSK